ncbi:MAG: hypothetical protein C0436_01645 [Alphaproteobacteria bacterium]|nr:hypothetical protein [Alphaproteobacteria bacterium]
MIDCYFFSLCYASLLMVGKAPMRAITVPTQAFSLVELSIVLVILGLLTGGILAGQSLIRASELRSAVTEYQRYSTSVQSFRDKYMAIPGDMRNATSFWGTAAACPGTVATPSTTPTTCNGNGDGYVVHAGPTSDELYRFWQHLANAGLIEGQYTGVTGAATAGTWNTITGQNVPRSKMSNGGWSAVYLSDNQTFSTTWYPPIPAGNTLSLGIADSSNALNSGSILRAEEMWNIDTKIDDGLAYKGKVMPWAGAGCVDAVSLSGNYLLTSTTISCAMMISNAF